MDHDSAVKYAHATLLEMLPEMKRRFPIRASVVAYNDFVSRHKRFLVLATPGYPEDWLLDKLKADRAELKLLANMETGYQDKCLFEVIFLDLQDARTKVRSRP